MNMTFPIQQITSLQMHMPISVNDGDHFTTSTF